MDQGAVDEVTREYRVEGHVQGVGFRWWTREVAREIGLRGWVRNEDDGSVRIRVAGRASQIERFERRIDRGPPRARVQGVHREEAPPAGPLFEGFEIIR